MPLNVWALLLPVALHAAPAADSLDTQIRTLLRSVRAHQDDVDKLLENFGYSQTWRKEVNGKETDIEISEVTFDHARKIARLTSRGGKPLQGSALEKEQKRVERQLRDLENGKAAPLNSRRVKLEDLLRFSIVDNIHKTSLDGREVWYAEFHPDPRGKPTNINERFAHSLDGKLWIDAQALQIARIEFILRDTFKVGGGLVFSMKPGSQFSEEKTWSFVKIWLPKMRRFQLVGKAMMGIKLNIVDTTTFSDFHEFNVDVKDSATAFSPAPAIH